MEIAEKHWNQFAKASYAHVERLISEADRASLLTYAVARARTTTMVTDTRVPGTPAAYADPRMEDLLQKLAPSIEQVTQLQLFPTYSYFRVYKRGDALERHTDRQACEISVSVTLGYVADAPWPLWIESPEGRRSIEMAPGDVVVYRGIDVLHWREPFCGEQAAQVFLHYVDKAGPRSEWKFDKRKRLGVLPAHVSISGFVRSSLRDDGVLELRSGMKVPLGPFESLIWRELEAKHTISTIVEHAQQKLNMTEPDAIVSVMKSLSMFENKGLVRF